jgi:serine/threonine protein kinase
MLVATFIQDNEKCDIWSVGVIAYMLLSGTPPFYGKTSEETLSVVRKGKWCFHDREFKGISSAAKGFIIFCLDKNVDTRPSAEGAMQHPWFDLLKAESQSQAEDNSPPISLDVIERYYVVVSHCRASKLPLNGY